MAGRRGGAIIIGQAAVSAILVATLYLPGEMTEISRMVDALIGGATALAVVALFPEQRPCYWSSYSRRERVKTMNSVKIVEEFWERVWKAGNPTARFPFTAPVTEPCNPPIAFVVQRRKEKIFGSPFALSKGMDAYTSTVRTKGRRESHMAANSSTALITGGTSGIGRATANKLAQLGIHVLVVGRNVERGEKTVVEIRAAGGKADFIRSDLRDASSAREVARRAVELGSGHVDILINNAGIFPFGPTHETTEEVFDIVYSLNVKAPYFLVAELAPLMAKRRKGAIVNVSTMVADYGAPGMSLYGSSKAAINLLTKTWAAEYGPSGLRVNAVSPGPTRTEGTEAMGEGLEQLAAQAPAGRPATADEIAEAIVFLAMDRSSFIHGAKLAVDGGRTAI